MAWVQCKFARNEIDEAGRLRVDATASMEDKEAALEIINNWRSCHAFPLNTIQVGLRRTARIIDTGALVAQRIKRLPAIEFKLHALPHLRLSEMQDIGGCRAVVSSVSQVETLTASYRGSHIKHVLHKHNDYINEPKDSGYRGVHLVYRYLSDRQETYNGQKIEIQIRSKLQHAWATAVETVGTFTQQALKSNLGKQDWLRFFALMGTALAIRERRPTVPGTPTSNNKLRAEIRDYAARLNVDGTLQAFGAAMKTITAHRHLGGKAHYFLLELRPNEKTTRITSFRRGELATATDEYILAEHSAGESDSVLVSVESMKQLRRAYPNYFLDTSVFLRAVREATAR